MSEQDQRVAFFNALNDVPHGKREAAMPIHRRIIEADPLFYVRLAAWYAQNGSVRDHTELFVYHLTQSDFPGHRDVGLALLRQMPPFQVAHIVQDYRAQKRNLPRSMKTEIARYLRDREADAGRFDRAVLAARHDLWVLYQAAHVKPSQRAQFILFDRTPPLDSLPAIVTYIRGLSDQAERARLIVEYEIPWKIASALVNTETPAGLVALVNAMTPQQVINQLASLKRCGAFGNADVKQLIDGKLQAAKTDKRVTGHKAVVAAAVAGLDEGDDELRERLEEVRTAQARLAGRITRPTAILVDKSGSMGVAIEVAKKVGAMIAGICQAALYVWAFDSVPYPIQPPSSDNIGAWEKAFIGIHDGGNTSIGAGLEAMRRSGQRVEQVVLITDEGENQSPTFDVAWQRYAAEFGAPALILVTVGTPTKQVETMGRALKIEMGVFHFKGDYYALKQLVPMLSQRSLFDLIMDIMTTPLPVRAQR